MPYTRLVTPPTTGMAEQPPAGTVPWDPPSTPTPPAEEQREKRDGDVERVDEEDNGGGRRISCWTLAPMFVLTFAAFVLLTLTTFSLPFIPKLYFLWSSQDGGVRFGIWGWCKEEGSVCSEKLGMGYTWEPEVAVPITKALALYPVAAVSVFMTLVAFIPILRDRSPRTLRVFTIFVWTSFTLALVVFAFMIAMWSVADERFKAAGWKVHWGPLPWMSFIAMLLLLIVALNTCRVISCSPSSSSPEPHSSQPNLDPPFSAEGWSTTAEEDQRIDSDPEKTHSASPTAHSPSSVLRNVFPPPSGTGFGSPLRRVSESKEGHSSAEGGESPTPGSGGELTRKQSHRQRYDSLAIAKVRYSMKRNSREESMRTAAAKAKAKSSSAVASTDITANSAIPHIASPPPRAYRRDSMQERVPPQLTPLHI